ncbi:MAG: flagellar protein FliT [Betaproteobacteria bacterium HGW-Betaproteobacteria-13]|jgi:flagellar protein FliT|uniref:Flagellar protein FliT n=1 Tax=Parazoarcus communis TaxID=41977 RepID=A0A2U8HA41_9RHOO|nr:flagellar protein FliT [Parazoarcus communis]AWI81615.1 flagellar protein FliT [Parazoarcus communis]PKO57191.1 MAG: flagellar protein FliT [Betaproteobacteria bacterium HGW-Betaproteobacteria-21]PKO82468.1 MAG: flagellar protein FliT [Betaproteobacteria bacterium HGW-Betaproteobacteria-13]
MLTPGTGAQLLSLYEAMAVAARENDWDQLAELEHAAADVRKSAQSASNGSVLSADEQRTLAGCIRSILELDREIRTHVEPALESTRKLLSTTVRDKAVRNAYGNLGG